MSLKNRIPLKQRAVKAEAKNYKRERLIEIASTLLNRREFHEISMDEVARTAGVAKGTLYLYFQTKEELCLAVYSQEFVIWTTEMNRFLSGTKKMSGKKFASWVASSLRAMPRFAKLSASVPVILEKNISSDAAAQFNKMKSEQLGTTATRLREIFRFKTEAQALRFSEQLLALIRGCWTQAKTKVDQPNLLELTTAQLLFAART